MNPTPHDLENKSTGILARSISASLCSWAHKTNKLESPSRLSLARLTNKTNPLESWPNTSCVPVGFVFYVMWCRIHRMGRGKSSSGFVLFVKRARQERDGDFSSFVYVLSCLGSLRWSAWKCKVRIAEGKLSCLVVFWWRLDIWFLEGASSLSKAVIAKWIAFLMLWQKKIAISVPC